MKLLVTGGAGFIGSALIRNAIAAGRKVVNVDKLTEKEEERLRNQEMGEKAVKVIADFTVKPLVLMLVWNMTLPTLGIATITYFGAVGLYVIARILFKHD